MVIMKKLIKFFIISFLIFIYFLICYPTMQLQLSGSEVDNEDVTFYIV